MPRIANAASTSVSPRRTVKKSLPIQSATGIPAIAPKYRQSLPRCSSAGLFLKGVQGRRLYLLIGSTVPLTFLLPTPAVLRCRPHSRKKLRFWGSSGGLQAAVYQAKRSKEEYFGLETEPTLSGRGTLS